MQRRLYLVGTVHYDVDGEYRLDRLLNALAPNVVGLETSEGREDINEKISRETDRQTWDAIRRHKLFLTSAQRRIFRIYTEKSHAMYGYEIRSSEKYTAANPKSRLVYIDLPLIVSEDDIRNYVSGKVLQTKEALKEMFNFMKSRDKLINHVDSDSRRFVAKIYANVEGAAANMRALRNRKALDKSLEGTTAEHRDVMGEFFSLEREIHMAGQIRQIAESEDGNVVVVTGLDHLPFFGERLGDMNPVQVPLSEYEKYL